MAVGDEPSEKQLVPGGVSMSQPLDETDRRAREVGRHQALFREVNERIEELAGTFGIEDELTILCECGSGRCDERIALREDEYERLRRIPTHFAVRPGHEIADVERVVERHDGFVVVEKLGESAKTAIRLDPRRRAG
jgi:hypothetical protein